MFAPSKYQSAIFSFIDSGNGHAVVDAVPGSGKTTTLLEASKLLPASAKALFCAFNAHIAKELGEKLKANGSSMECSTIHSLGKRILKPGTRLEEKKYSQLCRDYLTEQTINQGKPLATRELIGQLKKLVDFARLTLVEPTEKELTRIISHYDIEIDREEWGTLLAGVAPILEQGKRFYEQGLIDFTDMIWLPVVLNMACPQYDFLFVDECQDLNAAQLALVMRCCQRGRMLFVGDKRQSLYGFAGADTHSIQHIIEQTNATVLPLSICYRCPTSVVDLASKIFAGIEAAPGKECGTIEVIEPDKFAQTVKLGDLVLCRCTAPLVSQCLRLLRAGVKAQVRGKDIGKSFVDLINAVRFYMGFSLENLGKLAEDYRWQQLKVLERVPDNEMKVANLNDKVDTFHALYEAYLNKAQGSGSIAGFEAYLTDFFTDDLGNGIKPVMFSTVHKAKGLEYDRVFILSPDLMPHPAAKKDWQREQEYNIEYVAVTRAKQTLFFVDAMPANLQQEPEQAQPVLIIEEAQPAFHEPGALDIGADCEHGRHVDCMRRNCSCECHKPEQPRTITLALPESIMTEENAAPKTWVQAPRAILKERKTLRKPVGNQGKNAPGAGRKPKGKAPRVTLQLSVDLEVYERVMQMKAAGEIESASALFEALFKARY